MAMGCYRRAWQDAQTKGVENSIRRSRRCMVADVLPWEQALLLNGVFVSSLL
jgi:hypothetical protein